MRRLWTTVAAVGALLPMSARATPTAAHPVGTAPPCVVRVANDSYRVVTGENLNANVTDIDTTCGRSIEVISSVRRGTAGIASDGSFGYAAIGGFVGTDQWAYLIDNGSDNLIGIVTIEVLPVAAPTTTSPTTTSTTTTTTTSTTTTVAPVEPSTTVPPSTPPGSTDPPTATTTTPSTATTPPPPPPPAVGSGGQRLPATR